VLGNGNDTIIGQSNDFITLGNGNDTVSAGLGSAVTVGNGTDTVTIGSDSVITVGGGNDMVSAGSNSKITLGDGKDTLIVGSGNAITLGNGNDTIYLGADNTLVAGFGQDTFVLRATTDSPKGVGNLDTIVKFKTGSGPNIDKIDLSTINGITTIQGLVTPPNPSIAPPKSTLNAHSIAWYQVGSDTVVIANASSTPGQVDMEIVLKGVTASSLSTTPGVNFVPDPPSSVGALLNQYMAAGFGGASTNSSGISSNSTLETDRSDTPFLAVSQHGHG
jgi:hypothetical protein